MIVSNAPSSSAPVRVDGPEADPVAYAAGVPGQRPDLALDEPAHPATDRLSSPPRAVPTDGRIPPRWRWLILSVLAVAFLAIGLQQAGQDAPTVDEGVDLSSGVNSLVQHDLRMVPEHPALPKAIAALPALLAHPIVPDTAAYRDGRWFDWSGDFISANEQAGRLRPMLLWARAVVLVEAVGCAALIYLLARRFFGPDGGLLAAGAWLTTPYVVGLSHFAMIDVPFTLVTLATCVLLARWLDRPDRRRTVAIGLILGAALATRHTALVLVAVSFGVMAWSGRARPPRVVRQVLLSGSVAVITVWAVYRGLAPHGPSGAVADRFDGLVGASAAGSVVARLVTAIPLPTEWRAGFGFLSLTSTPRPASLLGSSWDGGRWWFFPVSALLKLPATLVLAVVAGWFVALRRAVDRRRLALVVALPAVTIWLFLVAQPLNLGLRLAVPVVALALVGVGALATLLDRSEALDTGRLGPDDGEPGGTPVVDTGRLVIHSADADTRRARGRVRPALVALVGLAVVVQLASSVAAAPHSLAWTPPPARPAYQWVSDASLDAGQAAYEVRRWAEGRDALVAVDTTRGLSVDGGTRPLADVDATEVRGWVAVGVTPLMQTRRDDLAWLRKYCPVGTLGGGSVLVYHFTAEPDPRPGPETPVGPCLGDPSSHR